VLRWTVVVDLELDPDSVAEVDALVVEDEELPTMWNGLEYWNVGLESEAVESSVIWKPYVAKELDEGIL